MCRLLGCAVTVVAVFPCACVRIPDRLPEDMPDELAFVIEHKEMFAEEADDPLARVVPGTVLDDLGELDGCWGAYTTSMYPLTFYVAIVFDSASGQITRWEQVDFLGQGASLFKDAGTFAIEGDNRIVGALRSFEYFLDSERFEELSDFEFQWPATLDGDRLKMRFPLREDLERNTDSQGEVRDSAYDTYGLTYVRFDCPR